MRKPLLGKIRPKEWPNLRNSRHPEKNQAKQKQNNHKKKQYSSAGNILDMPKTLCPGDCFGFWLFIIIIIFWGGQQAYTVCVLHRAQHSISLAWVCACQVACCGSPLQTFQAIQACADTSIGNGQRIWKLPKRGAPFKRSQLKATSNQLWPLFYWPSSLALWAAG